MGMLAKSVLYGAIAGSTWISARAVPTFLEIRAEAAQRSEVVAYAREVAVGHKLTPQDLTTVRLARELDDGSLVRQVSVCVGRTATCGAPAGAAVVQGCLGRGE